MARKEHGDDDEPRTNSPEDIGYAGPPTAKKPTSKDEGPRNFGTILAQVGDGDLLDELGVQFHEVLKELKHHVDYFQRDAKGSISLKLAIHARGDGSVALVGDVAIKKPTRKRGASTLFFTPGANLTLENPRQQKLPLREVPAANRIVRDLPANERAPR